MPETTPVTVHVADMDPVKALVTAAERMRTYEMSGGSGWWSAWDDVVDALAALRGENPPPRRSKPKTDAEVLAHARRRYEIAEQALSEIHAFVQAQLEHGYHPWDSYHTDTDGQDLAARLEREHMREADRGS